MEAEAEAPILGPPDVKTWLIEKDPDAGKDQRQMEKGWQRMRWLDSITHSMDMNLSKLRGIAEDRGAWYAKTWTQPSDWTTARGRQEHNILILKSKQAKLPSTITNISLQKGHFNNDQFSSVQLLSRVQLFATPWLQHTRPPCPSPTPTAYSNSCPLNRWCHPTISSSVIPFSSHLQSFPASGSFPMS